MAAADILDGGRGGVGSERGVFISKIVAKEETPVPAEGELSITDEASRCIPDVDDDGVFLVVVVVVVVVVVDNVSAPFVAEFLGFKTIPR